jgi:hypothetical protein
MRFVNWWPAVALASQVYRDFHEVNHLPLTPAEAVNRGK